MTEQEMQALVNEGASIDAAAGAHAEAAAAGNLDDKGNIIAPPDLTMEKAAAWFIFPKALAWAITTVFPETERYYTDAKCMELAHAIVPVAEKYGLDGPGDSPELTLLMGTGIFCVPAYLAYKQRKAQAEAIEAAPGKAAPAAPVKGETYLQPINGTAAGNGS